MLKVAPFAGRALLVVDSPDRQAHTVGMCRLLVLGSIMSVAYDPELEDALDGCCQSYHLVAAFITMA